MNNPIINNENTTDKAHSIFPPSSAKRHIECPPSLVMESFFPDETTEAASEGTAAHALGEWKARTALGIGEAGARPVSEWDSDEMEYCTDGYVNLIRSYRDSLTDPIVMLERAVRFDKYVEGGYGTADTLIVSEKDLVIIDLKYGRVEVSAENNAQMLCYALGALSDFYSVYPDIENITMVIFQPRINNVSVWRTTASEVLSWGDKVLRPRAMMALAGQGELCEGEWCKYCKAAGYCSKKNSNALASITREQLEKEGKLMTHEEVTKLIPVAYELQAWAKGFIGFVEKMATTGVEHYDGYKVVVGRYTKVFVDENAVVNAAEQAGIDKDLLFVTDFTSPAKLEKAIGRKDFKAIFGNLVTSKAGSLSLAPADDKREEVIVNAEGSDADPAEEKGAA